MDVFAPRCRGLCGKLCFVTVLAVWACDVTRTALGLCSLLPPKAATVRAHEDAQGYLCCCAEMCNLITVLDLGLNPFKTQSMLFFFFFLFFLFFFFFGCCYSSCGSDSLLHDPVT